MAISSYSNPIPEIIDGLLRGHQLGLQMQQAARADQEFKTQQAMHNQQMSMQDIMNQRTMQQIGRPVSAMGTVQDQLQTPSMPITPGVQAPASDTTADLYNLPQRPGPTMPGQTSEYARKADKSRTVDYKTLAGQKLSTEMYTPEEQDQQAAAKAALLKRANSTLMHFTPEEQQFYGFASPDTWIPNEHVGTYMAARATNRTRETLGTAAEQGRNTRSEDRLTSLEMRAAQAEQAKRDIAGGVQAGANYRSTGKLALDEALGKARNQTAIDVANIRGTTSRDVANIRGTTPTAGQTNVQTRFDQRRQDQAAKNLQALQTKENALHAERIQIGESVKAGTMKAVDAAPKLNSLSFRIQASQYAKAKAMGAASPPKAFSDSVPEGKYAASPDGHSWMKKDGILYIIR